MNKAYQPGIVRQRQMTIHAIDANKPFCLWRTQMKFALIHEKTAEKLRKTQMSKKQKGNISNMN